MSVSPRMAILSPLRKCLTAVLFFYGVDVDGGYLELLHNGWVVWVLLVLVVDNEHCCDLGAEGAVLLQLRRFRREGVLEYSRCVASVPNMRR